MINTIRKIKKYRITQQLMTEKLMELLYEDNIKNIGLTTVALSTINTYSKPRILSIEHSGNMGNSITSSIDPNLKKLGLPTISELKDIFDVIDEKGSPDYYYSIEFDLPIYKPKK